MGSLSSRSAIRPPQGPNSNNGAKRRAMVSPRAEPGWVSCRTRKDVGHGLHPGTGHRHQLAEEVEAVVPDGQRGQRLADGHVHHSSLRLPSPVTRRRRHVLTHWAIGLRSYQRRTYSPCWTVSPWADPFAPEEGLRMAKDALVNDALAAKFATEKDSPYTRWVAAEGLDIIAAHYVPDLNTVELKPWVRRGGRGVFINHEATRTSNDCYVCEIPAAGTRSRCARRKPGRLRRGHRAGAASSAALGGGGPR